MNRCVTERLGVVSLCVVLLTSPGCATKAGTGTLAGAGVGALVGQAVGGNTASTLIGTGVGAGVGYLIGNEADKADAKRKAKETEAELKPFAGTAWQLLSSNKPLKKPVKSLTARFNPDGTVTTTRVYPDGRTETASERYRVVGSTLIINQNDYVINAKYLMEGDRLHLDSDEYSVVLARV